MAVTTPGNIVTPDDGDDYALVQDLGAMADSIQENLLDNYPTSVANDTERDTVIPSPVTGSRVFRRDTLMMETYISGSWVPFIEDGTFTPAANVTVGSNTFLKRTQDVVTLNLHVSPTTGDWDTATTVSTLPAGWRPGGAMSFVHQSFDVGYSHSVNIGTVHTDGTVVVNLRALANQIIARGTVIFKVA